MPPWWQPSIIAARGRGEGFALLGLGLALPDRCAPHDTINTLMARFSGNALAAAIVLVCGTATAQLLPEKTPPKPKSKRALAERAPIEKPELVCVSEGEFQMGSESGGDDERPVHRVFVSGFFISKYPVSNADYKRFVDATGHRAPASKELGRSLWAGRGFSASIARQPVVNVSWDDSVAYCAWLSNATGEIYRLPTEAEWEKAARGGLELKKYPWGDEDPDDARAWFGKTWKGLATLRDIDYGPANGYGLYEMAGNVKQWVADLYNAHSYAHSSPRDPQGPFSALDRVVRGGSAFDDADHLRCASRGFNPPTERSVEIGFRVLHK